jgi:SPP1 family predicted phage head-tail adaptor
MSARIGSLSHRLSLEALQRTPDAAGGAALGWVEIAKVWARVRARGGRERFQADRMAGSASHDVVIRHREGVAPSMRLRKGSRSFHILAVLPDERRRFIVCECEERDL